MPSAKTGRGTGIRRSVFCVVLVASLVSPVLAQQSALSSLPAGPGDPASPRVVTSNAATAPSLRPFSRFALGGGVGITGINLQAATDLNRYANLRVIGNVFSYSVNNITSNGFTANGSLDLASMNAAVDFYPWPRHGFRLSPGIMLYNDNSLSAGATVNAGESFKLNDVEYYSSASNPVTARAKVGLNATNPAFTMTTGWGNMISRRGGHWSFPFELGAAFVGSPSFNMTLAGTACNAQGTNCVNAATNQTIQSNLRAQIQKYKRNVNALTVYPILSFGVSYNFRMRGQ